MQKNSRSSGGLVRDPVKPAGYSFLASVGRPPGFRATGWRRPRSRDRTVVEPAPGRSRARELRPRPARQGGTNVSFDIDVTRDGGWWMVRAGRADTNSLYPRGRVNGTRVHRGQYW